MTHDAVTDARSAAGARAGEQPGTARLIGLDLARGLAVLGMYAVHVGPAPSSDSVGGRTHPAAGVAVTQAGPTRPPA